MSKLYYIGKSFVLSVLILSLTGCADPIPTNRFNYVGEWQSNEMSLLILADGSVSYKRLKNGGSVSVNGPLKKFEGDNFIVGFLFFTTTFEVTTPPHEIDGIWKMTVDGVELTRVNNFDK
ncbi:hypothetical protein [Pleionea sediminis]|uniref:hypothetical protein n=1 Tax=Pleionea sediminis TaxID=2569479 RepID=UPI001FE65A12|nr:hypothetical protein [Pleionea sediminis]